MNNPLLQFSPPLTLATVFLILLEMLPSCLCDRYADCSTEFICGNTRASFPFWGNGRPNGCGVPELELRCTNGIPSIRLNNINYRVLQLNQYTQILNIAREDFLNGFCLPNFVNTTLDSRLFDCLPSYKNLTFFYGCPSSLMPLSLPFNCNVSVFPYETGFVLPPATGLGSCNSSVSVPVSSSLSTVLSSSTLENALKKGFEVRWKVDGTECNSCINSKGACGFDFTSNQFTCYCRGQSSGSTDCSSSSSSPDNKPVSLCDDDYRYANCSQPTKCGNISPISYPFWGVNRANYCGRPGYEVDCQNGVPVITVRSNTLRILDIVHENRTLKVAREDLWNKICLVEFYNTTLDFTIFNYAPGLTNLTLLFDCPVIIIPPIIGIVSLNDCSINGQTKNAFFVPRDVQFSLCNYSVKVPVLEPIAHALSQNIITITNALDEGFGLQWQISNDQCNVCIKSDGSCGWNLTTAQFTCFCHDQPNATKCPSRPGSKSKGVSVGVGVGVGGAVLAGILLGGWCLVIMKRRRSKAAQMEIQDMPEPSPSSKDPPTSTTYFSPSISSDPIPKPDIEKGSSYFGVQVFSHKELEKATDNFDSSKELGDGGFGTVYLGKLDDGRMVAVKRLYESNMKRAEQFINEVQILAHLRHKNLVALYGCTSRRSQELLLVYEYIPNGTVADHLHGRRADSRLLTWPLRLNIAIGTADALAYLHASDVIHRDVKTNNILLDNKFSVKVADFGLSRLFPNDVSHVSTAPQGTPGYVDPEYYQCYQLTDKSDVYSFGVVLIELISSLEAVNTNRKREDINLANMAVSRIQNHSVNELVDPCLGFEKDLAIQKMVTAVAELAFLCLQHERVMRPTMKEVLRALKRIEKEYLRSDKAKVVDIRKDDVGLLKRVPMPHSPDSVVQDKWVSSSTTSDSF